MHVLHDVLILALLPNTSLAARAPSLVHGPKLLAPARRHNRQQEGNGIFAPQRLAIRNQSKRRELIGTIERALAALRPTASAQSTRPCNYYLRVVGARSGKIVESSGYYY
eukprot:scaffold124251_cov36-Tisochrysis_lutea.AAC.1